MNSLNEERTNETNETNKLNVRTNIILYKYCSHVLFVYNIFIVTI